MLVALAPERPVPPTSRRRATSFSAKRHLVPKLFLGCSAAAALVVRCHASREDIAAAHAGTSPVITTMAPPEIARHSHFPLVTGIEYAPPPPGAVKLPQPDLHGHHHPAFEHVVSSRRSCRDFASPPSGALHLYELAQMCWAAQGITAPEEPPDEFGHAGAARRAAPSGGRLYPLTLLLVAAPGGAAGGLEQGFYRYLPESHALMNVRTSSNEQETVHTGEEVCEETDASASRESSSSFAAALAATVPQVAEKTRQDWIENAAALFVVSGAVSKTAKHGGLYARFADDLGMLEAEMVGAQLGLQAAALSLGATPVGAFEEDEVKRATFASKNRDATSGEGGDEAKSESDAAPDERPILMYAVGVPKGSYREKHGAMRLEDDQ